VEHWHGKNLQQPEQEPTFFGHDQKIGKVHFDHNPNIAYNP
jgi:hypothetical protein